MTWLPKRKHKEAHASEDGRKRQDKAAGTGKGKTPEPEPEKARDDVYKTPPEQDVLGWGHRKDYPPD
ncbi:hypothetical protein GCM10010324_18640 [Streptomyces hiroshimensis]|uniref:Uncharacterized protein n=1 Tax=Streptomyces hiroshimensis TaxID=66424 RepID=A0ABQ2YA14_9ACTN|nr:hypothetical protein [Streptomyces hiroshimensis]GGX73627.1 hypothetical protein GCM10010324_18640 [Streptomyces hiroshimensis]